MGYPGLWRVGRMLSLLLFLAGLFAQALTPPLVSQAQTSSAPVNVAGVVLFVQCPRLVRVTAEVKFAYVQLDGNAAVRSATVENRGLVQRDLPTVEFTRLSFDFTQDSLYRFILVNGRAIDILVEPEYWSVDRRSGLIYSGLSC